MNKWDVIREITGKYRSNPFAYIADKGYDVIDELIKLGIIKSKFSRDSAEIKFDLTHYRSGLLVPAYCVLRFKVKGNSIYASIGYGMFNHEDSTGEVKVSDFIRMLIKKRDVKGILKIFAEGLGGKVR